MVLHLNTCKGTCGGGVRAEVVVVAAAAAVREEGEG